MKVFTVKHGLPKIDDLKSVYVYPYENDDEYTFDVTGVYYDGSEVVLYSTDDPKIASRFVNYVYMSDVKAIYNLYEDEDNNQSVGKVLDKMIKNGKINVINLSDDNDSFNNIFDELFGDDD